MKNKKVQQPAAQTEINTEKLDLSIAMLTQAKRSINGALKAAPATIKNDPAISISYKVLAIMTESLIKGLLKERQ